MKMLETLALSFHITRRNWAVYRKDFLANISPTVADPIFFIGALGLGLGGLVSELDGRSYVAYLVPGVVVSTALFTAFFESSYGFFVRHTFESIFKAMLTTPIGVTEVVLGEFLWVGMKGACMVTGMSLIMSCFGMVENGWALVLAPVLGLLVAVPCGAMGLIATAYVRNINQFQTIYSLIISPLFFFSGIFFPIDRMPGMLPFIAKALPLYHGVELAQSIFWNQNIGRSLLVHGGFLLFSGLGFGFLAFHRIRRKLIS